MASALGHCSRGHVLSEGPPLRTLQTLQFQLHLHLPCWRPDCHPCDAVPRSTLGVQTAVGTALAGTAALGPNADARGNTCVQA